MARDEYDTRRIDGADEGAPAPDALAAFREELGQSAFEGGQRWGRAPRRVNATDNSIYQIEPAAVLEPRHAADVALAMGIAARHGIAMAPRGGGTGTNGQSLTRGVVLDTSRHMRRIVDFDPEAGRIRVGPGMILDELNAWLKSHGWMFAPSVSTGSRATIGGMVATDASGKGSCRYGRTSDHLLSVDVVFADGSTGALRDMGAEEIAAETEWDGPLGRVLACLVEGLPGQRDEIAAVFPEMNRSLTGYNLRDAAGPDGGLRLPKLFAGSEGTLAVATEIELSLTRMPAHRGLALLGYDDCDAALGSVTDLLAAGPEAVEFLDDTVVRLGRATPVWTDLQPFMGALAERGGFLFAEAAGDTPEAVAAQLAEIDRIAQAQAACRGCVSSTDPAVMKAMSEFRRDSVGLLSRGGDGRQGTAFVEDAAVPPANLAEFVRDFRAILDEADLRYGMFGHADAGCVHVRPMLNMRIAEDRALIRPISDAVAALAKRHGGLIWGEHGKGVRGEYLETYFGPALYRYLREIKTAFDPENRLNPGKLVVPIGAPGAVGRIDNLPFRGAHDAEIGAVEGFATALSCNGNGACFHWDAAQEMCPSYRATGDRVQSPKGRATLIRAWLREREAGGDPAALREAERDLRQSLSTCLSCKACTSQCPVRVDIPAMKSRFLSEQEGSRPRRDMIVCLLEPATILAAKIPALSLSRAIWQSATVRRGVERLFGMADLPSLPGRSVGAAMRGTGARPWTAGSGDLVLLTDSFLGVFDPDILAAAARCLAVVSDDVRFTPILANGKAREVRGLLAGLPELRTRLAERLRAIAEDGATLVSVEPAFTMLLRQEMGDLLADVPVASIEDVLHERRSRLPHAANPGRFRLIGHCTQTAADPDHLARWRATFAAAGHTLETVRSGCCGMAGLWGHEAENAGLSREIYDLSWKFHVEDGDGELLATGFSCRSQVHRFGRRALRHPAQVLAVQDG
ncbi:FAD/FMN-containing dehydrogenase [Palleronia aestuarii]|uniref:D-2-hydroxyglutarate dehydrogenase n=1 Tax=Palleronia aestuarii TaxID=568105 RepID=A0A2W7NG53_9RHOB|nr:FAD-binding and (Fe-S)-binding domain-containing protein [Palleronia aestuarii]PZX17157.1 FAD/FMN-containing dehydrogenase [Palleronia aestuarii]